VIESYQEGDVVEGRVTKVVTFGAFVEILPGVEGLVHISELAQHHVENPREIVTQSQPVNVKIIEVDADRRRLSLSLKRVEDTDPVQPRADGSESMHARPNLDLSEDVFAEAPVTDDAVADDAPAEDEPAGGDVSAEAESPFEVPTADEASGEGDATAQEPPAGAPSTGDDTAAEPEPFPAAEPPAEEARADDR
jgi:small subunit ribosomal protein S1